MEKKSPLLWAPASHLGFQHALKRQEPALVGRLPRPVKAKLSKPRMAGLRVAAKLAKFKPPKLGALPATSPQVKSPTPNAQPPIKSNVLDVAKSALPAAAKPPKAPKALESGLPALPKEPKFP